MGDVHRLNLSRFTEADIAKIERLHETLRLLRRWFRFERKAQEGAEQIMLYSGDRSHVPYAAYRLSRLGDGSYTLADHRSGRIVATGRTVDAVLERLPDRFYTS